MATIWREMATVWRVFMTVAVTLTHNHPLPVGADCEGNSFEIVDFQENAQAGELIFNLTSYSVVQFSPDNSLFLDHQGQYIVVKKDILLDGPSNEASCRNALETQPAVTINCITGTKYVKFLVNITDDYSPSFTRSEITVAESLPVGSTVVRLNTVAADLDCKNQFFFSIDDASKQYFAVNYSGNLLVLNQQLDYELQAEHRVNLTVTSNTQSSTSFRTNSTVFTVRVADIDDMIPVFDDGQFVLHVMEGQSVPSAWLTASPPVKARDGDVGINTTLRYSIDRVNPTLDLEIKNLTGEVRILEPLDREHMAAYTVVVRASQVDLDYKTATATLSILVDDANDNPPVFRSQTNVAILEDAPNGSQVVELTGVDLDEGVNAEFDFVIGTDNLQAFGVSSQPGSNRTYLVVRNSTNLRGQSLAHVLVKLVERQTGSCDYLTTCVGNVTVYINDVNDHAPQFVRDLYEFSVSSNTSGRVLVGQVRATDADKADNAKVVYGLASIPGPADCSKLALDPHTGDLSTGQQLPAGVLCSWIVTACDTPVDVNTRRCSSAYMSVAVTASGNIHQLNVSVLENVPIGTLVTSLVVKGALTSSPDFDITNDMLYTKVPLDRERQDLYLVTVQTAHDPTATVMDINVHIQDVNDNTPTFEHPIYVINLDSDVYINKTVLQVRASDMDTGNNSRFAFSLANGKEYFAIDPQTGHIRIINVATTDSSEYQLLVTDFGQQPLTGMASLKVYSPVHNETATVILPVSRDKLLADRDGVAKKLSSILAVVVRIYNIESLGPAPDVGSKLYISATASGGRPLSPTELTGLLETHALDIYSKFRPAMDDWSSPGKLKDLEIGLICVSVVLLVLVILVVLLWCRSQKRYKHSLRLFNTLNKDTTFYDNPRKPSTAAVALPTSTTNAQRMLARLSNGSVGHSSMSSLIPTKREVTTPPTSDVSERRQVTGHHYENVVMSPQTNPQIDDSNDRAQAATFADKTSQDQITTCGSRFPELAAEQTSSTQPNLDVSFQFQAGQDLQIPAQNGINSNPNHNNGSSSYNLGGGEGNIEEDIQVEDIDEDDEEVAHILSNPNSQDVISSLDDADLAVNNSSLDLMTTLPTPVMSLSENRIAVSSCPDSDMGEGIQEPEPDYAKRVRFSEQTEADTAEDLADSNISLDRLKVHQEVPSGLNAPLANTREEIGEELTAL